MRRTIIRKGTVIIPTGTKIVESSLFDKFKKEMTGILIPSSVTEIGDHAFTGCRSLTSVSIPESVTRIGAHAFCMCSSLKELEIPSSVTEIVDNPFSGCSSLERISVSADNSRYDAREDCNAIIDQRDNTLVTGCKNTVIPSSVKRIGDNAFRFCEELTEIHIPSAVISIGEGAFEHCEKLSDLLLPSELTTIGKSAFSNCLSLTDIEIPSSVTEIGRDVFFGCNALEDIKVAPGNHTYDSREGCHGVVETAGNTLIAGCKNTVIPQSVKSIRYAFGGIQSLASIVVPDSVTEIGESAFCATGLTSLTIPNTVTLIGDDAFAGCCLLKDISIPSSVTTIGKGAFRWCHSLSSIEIPASVTAIGEDALEGDWALTSIMIPESMTEHFMELLPEELHLLIKESNNTKSVKQIEMPLPVFLETPVEKIPFAETPEMPKSKKKQEEGICSLFPFESLKKQQRFIAEGSGWGYSKEDAVIVNTENSMEGVHFEYDFCEIRSKMECTLNTWTKFVNVDYHKQTLINKDDRYYDILAFQVDYLTPEDWMFFRNQEQLCRDNHDEEGLELVHKMETEKTKHYITTCWFDVTRFFGKISI